MRFVLYCAGVLTAVTCFTAKTDATLLRRAPALSIHGHISREQRFERNVGSGLVIAFEPDEWGWHLDVRRGNRRDPNGIGFASIATPPLHGPTALDIEGWQFRNANNTAANDGSVNAPQMTRDFSFVLTEKDATALADEISDFQEGKSADLPWNAPMGRGTLRIRNLRLGNLVPGSRARIDSMDFTISLRFP